MGYRSEVVLALSKEMLPHFMAVMAQEPKVRAMVFEDADTFDRDYDCEGGWLMYWGSVKWQECYPEVAAIEAFVQACDTESLESWDAVRGSDERTSVADEVQNGEWLHFRFVRMGENSEDVEDMGSFSDDSIYLQRSVSF